MLIAKIDSQPLILKGLETTTDFDGMKHYSEFQNEYHLNFWFKLFVAIAALFCTACIIGMAMYLRLKKSKKRYKDTLDNLQMCEKNLNIEAMAVNSDSVPKGRSRFDTVACTNSEYI